MLIIGSLALGADCVRILQRVVPKDIDLILTRDEFLEFMDGVEAESIPSHNPFAAPKYHLMLDGRHYEIDIAGDNNTTTELHSFCVLRGMDRIDMDILYTMKMSHRYLRNNPYFHKTRNDILRLRAAGARIFDKDWYQRRQEETYWYQHPNLNRSKDEFFSDDIPYYYDHDWLHTQLAIGDRPAYTHYLKDEAEVMCDKSKWDALDLEIKLRGVAEEAAVLAYERSIIPYNTTRDKMFPFALQKVATSITSGWFREFAWENFDAALAMMKHIPVPEVVTGMVELENC